MRHLSLLFLALLLGASRANADSIPQSLPFSQNWSNTGLITAADDWSGVPGIVGYRGDGLAVGTGVDPQTVLADDTLGVVDVLANQANPITLMTGGVAEFELSDPVVALAGSGTATAPYLAVNLNTTGLGSITVKYLLIDLEGVGSIDNAVEPVALQYRAASIGSWTNVPAAYVADATVGPGLPIATSVSAQLPVGADNRANLQIRIITTNATGSDEWVGVDNIAVSGTPLTVLFTSMAIQPFDAWFGCAWGDYDGDGDPDLYMTNIGGGPSRLLRNDGAGFFSPVTPAVLQNTPNGGAGAAWGDYDNDGRIDLYVGNRAPAANRLFRNAGGGSFLDATTGPLLDTGDTRGVAWADYDGDGDLDLLVANLNTQPRLLRNDGGSGFSDHTSGALLGLVGCRSIAWLDIDNDGDLDLYVARANQPNRLLRNQGGTWLDVTPPALAVVGDCRAAAAADFDNDGDVDLALGVYGAPSHLFRDDGATWSEVASALNNPDNTVCVAWADYDDDGAMDLFRMSAAGSRLYRNTGNGTLVNVTYGSLAAPYQGGSCAWGDADGDGRLDLWVSPENREALLLKNQTPTANHWLNLDLHGVTTNRSAIGARVRAVAGSLVQTRWVGMGNGIGQSSLTVELGIGAATQIDTLQVFWPSGIRQDTVAVASNQRLDLYEHLALLDVGEPLRVPGRTIERISPNPFGRGTRIDYALAAPGRVHIAVHDVTGRRVATLVDAAAPAGRGSVTWNPAAKGLRAGVYEIRVESEGGTATQRVVYTR